MGMSNETLVVPIWLPFQNPRENAMPTEVPRSRKAHRKTWHCDCHGDLIFQVTVSLVVLYVLQFFRQAFLLPLLQYVMRNVAYSRNLSGEWLIGHKIL